MEDAYRIEQLLIEAGFDGFVPNKGEMTAMSNALVRTPIDYLIDVEHKQPMNWKMKFRDTHDARLHNAFCVSRLPITEEQRNPDLTSDRLRAGFQLLTMRGDR